MNLRSRATCLLALGELLLPAALNSQAAPAGRARAVMALAGDRSVTGLFAERIRFPAGDRGTPHIHSAELLPDGRGGTDLSLVETDVPEGELMENLPGWVSLLLNLKAAVDFGVDLRNRDPARQWEQGYVDV